MSRRDKVVNFVGSGEDCPKCGEPMRRYEHSPDWVPRPGRYWFAFWDRCLACRRLQHYEDQKQTPRGSACR